MIPKICSAMTWMLLQNNFVFLSKSKKSIDNPETPCYNKTIEREVKENDGEIRNHLLDDDWHD